MIGTVKWFSNRKGFGFLTPESGSTMEDVFVHQSNIMSEGYRTLDEGWQVEFIVGLDEKGRPKAETVTAVGGGSCSGPTSPRRNRRRSRKEAVDKNVGGNDATKVKTADVVNAQADDAMEKTTTVDAPGTAAATTPMDGGGGTRRRGRQRGRRTKARGDEAGAADNTRPVRPQEPFWHASLEPSVAECLSVGNSIRMTTGTVDLLVHNSAGGTACVKLGTGGYASTATSSACVAEGTFASSPDGIVTLTWDKIIRFEQIGVWAPVAPQGGGIDVPVTLNLTAENIGAVPQGHDRVALMGDGPTDPRGDLESNGFKMRRIVLTPRVRRSQ